MKVHATPGFVLLMAVWFLLDRAGLYWCALPAAALHEAGHLAAIRLCGGQPRLLTLSAGGLRIDYAGALSWSRECAVALAGAAANLLAAILACVWYARTGRADAACMGGVQLLFACSNLLPLHALDGGQALRALLCRRLPLGTAEGLSLWVSRFFSGAILIFGLYIAFKTRYNSLILVSGSMLLAGNANKAKEATPLWMSV